jgi:uncharacterized protein (DUF697 family)
MAKKKDDNADKETQTIKIKRKRRRLYESDNEAAPASPVSGEQILTDDTDKIDSGASGALSGKEASTAKAIDSDLKDEIVRKIIRKYTYLSASTALVPIPVIDFLAITTFEIKMIHELCREYQVKFSKERTAAVIGSLVGGLHAVLLTCSLLKSIPLIGMAVTSAGAVSGAITYAVGIVFVKHFDLGGSLFDFNPASYRKKFDLAFKEGRCSSH